MEPDELYTLRAQYYLGHYALSLEEAKATARRPLSNDLKIEREEFQLRSMLALKQYDKVIDSASDISNGECIGYIGNIVLVILYWIGNIVLYVSLYVSLYMSL